VKVDPTRALAQYVSEGSFEDLPSGVTEQAQLLLLDGLGVAILGSIQEGSREMVESLGRVGGGGESTVFGFAERLSPFAASFANASMMHQVELGDSIHRASVHASSTVVPAAFAIGERVGATGPDLVRAIVFGVEVLIRFGMALARELPDAADSAHEGVTGDDSSPMVNRGWHTPGLLATMGSSTTAALILGSDAEVLHHTWGLAANYSPAASRRYLREHATGKGSLMGAGCSAGIVAAELAAGGMTGLENIVESWMPLLVPSPDPAILTYGLGDYFEMENIRFKYFSTVGALFPALEAMFAILERDRFDAEEVERIDVEGYARMVFHSPKEAPTSAESARTNLAYCLAVAVLSRDRSTLVHAAFTDEWLDDERTQPLARKVSVHLNERYQSLFPDRGDIGCVRVRLSDGTVLEQESDVSKIGRYLRPSWEDIAEKFRVLSELAGITRTGAERAIEIVRDIRTLEDTRTLTAALR
jgi:2-methylcitrate dehydratase PrpD